MRGRFALSLLIVVVGVSALSAGGGAQVARATSRCSPFNDRPAWSPDGSRIAFTKEDGSGRAVWLMNADGSDQQNLTTAAVDDVQPAWSPDGNKIAFVRWVPEIGDYRMHVVNADGTGMTNLGVRGFQPTWSPHGDKIAFTAFRGTDFDLYVMSADGTNQQNLTATAAVDDFWPAWSPDGSKIAFVRATGTLDDDIYVMNADGSGVTDLTPDGFQEVMPAWSPDGSRMAFWLGAGPGGGTKPSGLYLMNSDGSDMRALPLPKGFVYAIQPNWSRTGRIAFERDNGTDIYTVSPDGSGLRNLTKVYGCSPSGPIVADEHSFRTVPKAVRHGGRLTAILSVRDDTNAPIAQGTATCRAATGGRALRLVGQEFTESRARCTWRVPRSAKGKFVKGIVTLRSEKFHLSWTFTRHVR